MRIATKRKLRSIFCAVFRHSHLVTNCFGYKYCARCNAQLGDSLAGTGLPVGRNGFYQIGQTCTCDDCRASFDSLTWLDRFLCPKAEWPTPEYLEERCQEKESIRALLRQKV